ncbi:IS30 family transposase [Streptomyces sp. NPDC016734]|uniref:IS30 family transposase n=1 Tax=Streptomyces TaxID=1883 RepID=UPI0037B8E59C
MLTLLREEWSPEQIVGHLRLLHSHDLGMQISHETIYRSVCTSRWKVVPRELCKRLRTGRPIRKNKRHTVKRQWRSQIIDARPIEERAQAAEDRSESGHLEGDLVIGSKNSQVATLVDRKTRWACFGLTGIGDQGLWPRFSVHAGERGVGERKVASGGTAGPGSSCVRTVTDASPNARMSALYIRSCTRERRRSSRQELCPRGKPSDTPLMTPVDPESCQTTDSIGLPRSRPRPTGDAGGSGCPHQPPRTYHPAANRDEMPPPRERL